MKKKLRLTLMTKMIVGFLIGFLIATLFNLPYAYTAGVIAVLSLEMTRKKSYTIGLIRLIATLIGLGIATLLFFLLGYEFWVLIILMAVFIPAAFLLKIEGGIVVTLVLVSQLYLEKDFLFVFNALYIFAIGLGVATLLNFWMPPLKKTVANDIHKIDNLLDKAINDIASQKTVDFTILNNAMKNGRQQLNDDIENQYSWNQDARSAYLLMRERQVAILKRVEQTLKAIENLPQKQIILEYLATFKGQIGEENYAASLAVELNHLFDFFQASDLPKTRAEFENRAQLFYILKELETFLNLKLTYHEKYQLTMGA